LATSASALKGGNFTVAVKLLSGILKDDPTNWQARALLLLAYLGTNSEANAKEEMLRLKADKAPIKTIASLDRELVAHAKARADIAAAADTVVQAACDNGRNIACSELSHRLYFRDETRSTLLLERACTLNDASGCRDAAYKYRSGLVVSKDVERAATLSRLGCDLRDLGSCEALALAYENGMGVATDYAQAPYHASAGM
jgi:TPR repeat protein